LQQPKCVLFQEFLKALARGNTHILVDKQIVKMEEVVPELFQCVDIPTEVLKTDSFLAEVFFNFTFILSSFFLLFAVIDDKII
jgi:hypothetical protein